MKRSLLILGLLLLLAQSSSFARENLKELFQKNEAIIYTINIRSFASDDLNSNSIIELELGEKSGSFLSAIGKLEKLKQDGINTIYLLPITPTGKLKAIGTAGSLYAMDSFHEINPILDDKTNDLTVYEEAKLFINKAHELDLNVIVDLPSCGSFDLTLEKPDWFIFDRKKEALIPADWTDVRLFKIYNKDKTLNSDNLKNFKNFVDMVQDIGFDGIRADVAAIKPFEFWKEIIDYSRIKNKDFVFLAEASSEWTNPAKKGVSHYATIDELLKAGFDCYYGPWSDFKNIKSKKEFDKKIKKNLKILKRNKSKSMLATFATHDQQAPIIKGENYWNMVLWLTVTMQHNSYFLDGFSVGDDFIYEYENKKCCNSLTDDEYYYVHSGMYDIFNLTSSVREKNPQLKEQYLKAIDFKNRHLDLFRDGKFKFLKTSNDKIFAYSLTNESKELIVVGSFSEKENLKTSVKSKNLKKDYVFSNINTKKYPIIEKDKINVELEPMEIQVYMVNLASSQAM